MQYAWGIIGCQLHCPCPTNTCRKMLSPFQEASKLTALHLKHMPHTRTWYGTSPPSHGASDCS